MPKSVVFIHKQAFMERNTVCLCFRKRDRWVVVWRVRGREAGGRKDEGLTQDQGGGYEVMDSGNTQPSGLLFYFLSAVSSCTCAFAPAVPSSRNACS